LADRLLTAVRPCASPGHGRITPPGAEGGYGHDVDGLEGFARTFLLAGFRLAGATTDPLNLAEWYAQGLVEGTDPKSPYRWVRLTEHDQAKVEAASLALILDLTRDQIWNRLDAATQDRLIGYLSPVVGDTTYPRNNWLWFRIVVETFLRSVGGPWSPEDIEADLALHDSFIRQDGWLADGAGRDYDHYVGWALHLYPTLWQRMRGAQDLATPQRRERDTALLDRYLQDAVHLVGANGSPLIQGRSLIYRFAAAAPFWVGALAEVPSVQPGLLRRAASGIVSHFANHGVPNAAGLLTMGWFNEWRPLAQSYSGPGSPYWATKGLLGLALPASHPVWTATEQDLPVERGDFTRAIAAPGWILSGTRADGVIRLANHGTDHTRQGDLVADSPLYANLGYSTATCPLLDESAWITPQAQSATLVDPAGRATHRAGFTLVQLAAPAGAPAVAASAAQVHWLDPAARQFRHGSGFEGQAQVAGQLTMVSVLRGPWEVRGVRLDRLDVPAAGLRLRLGGWPLTGPAAQTTHTTQPGWAAVTAGAPAPGATGRPANQEPNLTSAIAGVSPEGPASGIGQWPEASPLGSPALVPWLDYPLPALGAWTWCLVTLTGDPQAAGQPAAVTHAATDLTITWPDGITTLSTLNAERQN
jgi:hypothetical protein